MGEVLRPRRTCLPRVICTSAWKAPTEYICVVARVPLVSSRGRRHPGVWTEPCRLGAGRRLRVGLSPMWGSRDERSWEQVPTTLGLRLFYSGRRVAAR